MQLRPGRGNPEKMKADRIKAWVQASRPPFFIATLVPLFMGLILASGSGLHAGRFLLVVAACFMVHLATNLANDYFDHLEGTDAGASIGGSRVIQEGKISPASLLKAIIGLYSLACLIALYLVIDLRLFAVVPLALFAFFSSLFYVAPPIRYGYHGLGELFVGINMGPIMVVGTYWVMAGQPALEPLWVSIPVGLMVAFILYYQSLPDMGTDLAVGKRTLAVRLGKNGALAGLVVFSVLVYVSIAALIWAGLLSWLAAFGAVSIPLALKVVALAMRTPDWVLLDSYGKYVRMFYFINGLALIAGLL
jgi:1,4-dihydroxy-2-naphthoate octaprenyltransferase